MAGWIVAESQPPALIEVVLQDCTTHRVKPSALDVLLKNDRILKFRRAEGWVTVGIDPIRVKPPSAEPVYTGPERRTRH